MTFYMDLKGKKILFADLDGTLIETASGKTFAEDLTDFRLRKGVLDKIRGMESLAAIVIVSNQGGIPEYVSEDDFKVKMYSIRYFMQGYCRKVTSFMYCTSKDRKELRKPNVGMLVEALGHKPLSGFRFKKSEMLMIGDASGKEGQFSDSDKKCAENFGIDYMDVEDFLLI